MFFYIEYFFNLLFRGEEHSLHIEIRSFLERKIIVYIIYFVLASSRWFFLRKIWKIDDSFVSYKAINSAQLCTAAASREDERVVDRDNFRLSGKYSTPLLQALNWTSSFF